MAERGQPRTVPSLASLTPLLGKVLRQYDAGVRAKSVNFYPSLVSVASQSIPGPSQSTSIPWTIRCVPALLEKAKSKARVEGGKDAQQAPAPASSPQQKSSDVFAPPYHPDLLVEEMLEHTILLNKFCVVPRHFLLVTKDFQPQTLPPSPQSLAVAYRILHAHQRLSQQQSPDVGRGKELLAFYNCGKVSGASQPHQHIQFAELGGEGEEDDGRVDRDARHAIPVEELLGRIVKDGKEEEHVHALPLPYQHFVGLLSRAQLDDDAALCDYLGMKLLSLLDALFKARISADALDSSGQDHQSRPLSPSWNLLMTTRALHLIPRNKEDFEGLIEGGAQADKVDDGVQLMGNVSINSLGYAGHLLVKSQEELYALQRYPGGMVEVLRQTGVAPVDDVTAANEP